MRSVKKGRQGFSLIEVVAAITILGLVAVPVCINLVTAHRVNQKTARDMQDWLVASAAAEVLLSAGVTVEYQESAGIITFRDPSDAVTADTAAGLRALGHELDSPLQISVSGLRLGEACPVSVRYGSAVIDTYVHASYAEVTP